MRTKEQIHNDMCADKGRPNYESAMLEVLLDIRDILVEREKQEQEFRKKVQFDLLKPSSKEQ